MSVSVKSNENHQTDNTSKNPNLKVDLCIVSTFCLTFEILKLPGREILKVGMTWLTQDKSFLLDVFSFSISDSWELDQRDSHEEESQNQSKSKYVGASTPLYEFNF